MNDRSSFNHDPIHESLPFTALPQHCSSFCTSVMGHLRLLAIDNGQKGYIPYIYLVIQSLRTSRPRQKMQTLGDLSQFKTN